MEANSVKVLKINLTSTLVHKIYVISISLIWPEQETKVANEIEMKLK